MGVSRNYHTDSQQLDIAESNRFTESESESDTSGCEFCNDTAVERKCAIAEVKKQIDAPNAVIEKYTATAAKFSTGIAEHAEGISVWTEIEESSVIDLEECHGTETELMFCNMTTDNEMNN